jgi:hypothetical protein
MKPIRQVVCAVLIAALVFSVGATCFPTDADAGLRHVAGCLAGAAGVGRVACRFGPWFCAAGLLGGCTIGILVVERVWD